MSMTFIYFYAFVAFSYVEFLRVDYFIVKGTLEYMVCRVERPFIQNCKTPIWLYPFLTFEYKKRKSIVEKTIKIN